MNFSKFDTFNYSRILRGLLRMIKTHFDSFYGSSGSSQDGNESSLATYARKKQILF